MFKNNSPCSLTVSNMDRGCGLGECPDCEVKLGTGRFWFKNVDIVAICEAPWVGGMMKDRPLAIVYQCRHCFEHFWFHTNESHKETLEELYKESDGFTK